MTFTLNIKHLDFKKEIINHELVTYYIFFLERINRTKFANISLCYIKKSDF